MSNAQVGPQHGRLSFAQQSATVRVAAVLVLVAAIWAVLLVLL